MTCVRFRIGGTTGIICFVDESEPFFFEGKRWLVNKQFGPFACDRNGDPLKNQPSGRQLQRAFEHYELMRKGAKL